MRLQPADEGYQAEVQTRHRLSGGENNENGRVEGTGPGRGQGWLLHAQANLRFGHLVRGPGEARPARPSTPAAPRRTAEDPRGLRSKQEEHLHFGPRWRVLHQACYGDGEALGRLALPEKFRGDLASYGLHPALLDLATGFALPLAPGYQEDGSKDLWVPLSYKRVKVHADLTDAGAELGAPEPVAAARRASSASTSPSPPRTDRVLVEVDGFTMRRLAESDFAAPQAADRQRSGAGGPGARARAVAGRGGLPARPEPGHHPGRGLAGAQARAGADGSRIRRATRCWSARWTCKALIHQAGQVSAAQSTAEPETKFARPQLESEYLAPRTEIEKTLVGFWEGLLGVNQIGVRDSFFELGGHSLIAVRLFAKIRKTYDVDYPISVLFEAPTIEACARLIAQTVGDGRTGRGGGRGGGRAGAAGSPPRRRRRGTRPGTPTWCRCKVAAAARGTSCRFSWWPACSATC